jgi:ankyrin repeat protein
MMRSALFVLFCVVSCSGFSHAADHLVPGDYPTIQAAIDAAAAGDTVRIAPGTYSENLLLKDGVTLDGEDRETTIVRSETTDGPVLRVRSVASGSARGLTFEHAALAEKAATPIFPFPVVEIVDSTVELDSCRIRSGAFVGALVLGGAPTIQNCRVDENASTGIYCWGKEATPVIAGCEIVSNGASGISFYDHGMQATLNGTVIRDNKRYGINIGHKVTVEGSGNDVSQNALLNYWELDFLMRSSDYGQLEAIATHLRNEKSRYHSGEWQLGFYYNWVGGFFPMDTPDKERNSLAKLDTWKAAHPDSLTWRLILTNAYQDRAWKSRGGGYAYTVTEEGWKGYREYMSKAWKAMDDAANCRTKDPHYFLLRAALTMEAPRNLRSSPTTFLGAIIQTLASVFEDGTGRTAFLKGTAIEPLYYPLYYERTRDLLPRWHGSQEEMLAFAEESADKTHDLAGDTLYAVIVTKVSDWEEREALLDYGFSWDRIKSGYETILTSVVETFYRRNHYCRLACLYEDAETAKAQFTALRGHWDSDVWSSKYLYDNYRSWALGERSYPVPSPLERAVRDGSDREVRRLLDAGTDPNTKTLDGDPAIMLAVMADEYRILETLLDAGADPNLVSPGGETTLRYALNATDSTMLRLLLEHGVDPNQTNEDGWSLLLTAINWGRNENAKSLLEHGADPNYSMKNGWTALMEAANRSDLELVKRLVERGADLDAVTENGWTACHYATQTGSNEIVQFMLQKQPDLIGVRNRKGQTILHQAVRSGHLDVVRAFVEAGADVNAGDTQRGKTPLDYAIQDQHEDIVAYLREHGATE